MLDTQIKEWQLLNQEKLVTSVRCSYSYSSSPSPYFTPLWAQNLLTGGSATKYSSGDSSHQVDGYIIAPISPFFVLQPSTLFHKEEA
jgi:hypothetical protein